MNTAKTRSSRLATFLMIAGLPLLTGCNDGLAWGFSLDWYSLILFAPLRALYALGTSAILNQF